MRDSGGTGKFRGGLAVSRDWRFVGEQPATLSIRSDRSEHPPYGLYAGGNGAPSWNIVHPPCSARRRRLGRSIRKSAERDVLDDKVSIAKAAALYGVVIDRESGGVDEAATERLRSDLRQAGVECS